MTRRISARLPLVALAVAGAAACSDAGDTSADGRTLPEPRGTAATSITPARYVTDMSFVPFGGAADGLHFRFRHRTSETHLRRAYGAWNLDADGWRRVLTVADSLPLPRAGWRVLPTDGLRVLVSENGDIEGLVLRDTAAGTRLAESAPVAEWSSPTGQPARLLRATLTRGGETRDGLLVERRTALPQDAPPPRGLYGFLLLTTEAGDGMVLLRQGGTPPGREPPAVDTTVVGHGWLGEEHRSWSRMRLEELPGERSEARASPPAGWSLSIPAASIRGRLRTGPLVETESLRRGVGTAGEPAGDGDPPSDGASSSDPVRLYAVSGTLRIRGRERPVSGIGVETGEP